MELPPRVEVEEEEVSVAMKIWLMPSLLA